LVDILRVGPNDVDFFTAGATELYRHTHAPIFLFLIIGGESVLVHVTTGVSCAPRKVGTSLQQLRSGWLAFSQVPADYR